MNTDKIKLKLIYTTSKNRLNLNSDLRILFLKYKQIGFSIWAYISCKII